jgi:hypothetical protein
MVDVCIPPGRNRALHLFTVEPASAWRVGGTAVVPAVRLVVLECFSYAVYAAAAAQSAPDFYTLLDARLVRQVPTLADVTESVLATALDAASWVALAAAHRDAGLDVSLVLGDTPSLFLALDSTVLGLSTGEWNDATTTWHLHVAPTPVATQAATALARLPLPSTVSWSSDRQTLYLASPSRDVDSLVRLLAAASALRAAVAAFVEGEAEWHVAPETGALTLLVPGGNVSLTLDYFAGTLDKAGWLSPTVTLTEDGPTPPVLESCLAQALRVSWRRNHLPAFAQVQTLLTDLHRVAAPRGGFSAVEAATLLPRTTDQEAVVRLIFRGERGDAEMVRCLVC